MLIIALIARKVKPAAPSSAKARQGDASTLSILRGITKSRTSSVTRLTKAKEKNGHATWSYVPLYNQKVAEPDYIEDVAPLETWERCAA